MVKKQEKFLISLIVTILIIFNNVCFADVVWQRPDGGYYSHGYSDPTDNDFISNTNKNGNSQIESASSTGNLLQICAIGIVIVLIVAVTIIIITKYNKKHDKNN